MKYRISIRIVACIIVVACANVAGAQWYSTPSQNRGAGSSSYGAGGATYYNNANGSSAGRSTTIGNTTYHYNANGSSAGSSTRMGNTTYYYGPNGAPAGSATAVGR